MLVDFTKVNKRTGETQMKISDDFFWHV